MKPSEILNEISNLDYDELKIFIGALNFGWWDEWDCSLDEALKIFSIGKEFNIAAQSAVGYARIAEDRI